MSPGETKGVEWPWEKDPVAEEAEYVSTLRLTVLDRLDDRLVRRCSPLSVVSYWPGGHPLVQTDDERVQRDADRQQDEAPGPGYWRSRRRKS